VHHLKGENMAASGRIILCTAILPVNRLIAAYLTAQAITFPEPRK
jgi:hypothetical protein